MGEHDRCPDGGTCHHDCTAACFRVETCEPLTGVFPDDRWPTAVLVNPAPKDSPLARVQAHADAILATVRSEAGWDQEDPRDSDVMAYVEALEGLATTLAAERLMRGQPPACNCGAAQGRYHTAHTEGNRGGHSVACPRREYADRYEHALPFPDAHYDDPPG